LAVAARRVQDLNHGFTPSNGRRLGRNRPERDLAIAKILLNPEERGGGRSAIGTPHFPDAEPLKDSRHPSNVVFLRMRKRQDIESPDPFVKEEGRHNMRSDIEPSPRGPPGIHEHPPFPGKLE
jgi:hypothetical protein